MRSLRSTVPATLVAALAAAGGAPVGAQAAAEVNRLEAVQVQTTKTPYRSLFVTGALKTDTAIRDLAQSVRVLSDSLLADAGVTRLDQALDLGSGIARQSNFGGLWDSYAIRGFTGDPNFGSDYMVNGFNSSRGYNGSRDTANTATIELLKGPASALYGRGEPGGTVNIVTKKPLFQRSATLTFGGDSDGRRRSTADLTGSLGAQLAYRLNLASDQGGSFRDHVSSDRRLVAPALLWRLGDAGTVSYELEVSRQRVVFDRGVVAVRGQLGLLPRSRFLGEPGDGRHAIRTTGHQLFVQYELSPDWAVQAGLSQRESGIRGVSTEGRFLLDDDRSLVRQRRSRDYSATDLAGRVELLGQWRWQGQVHHLLLGVDGYRFVDQRLQYRVARASVIDIYEPVYDQPAPPMPLGTWTREVQRSSSVYAQDQVDLSAGWKLLLGLRRDHYAQSLLDRRRDVTTAQALGATTPRVGLVYQPGRTLALYATASRSFRPNSGISRAFQSFPAEQGRAAEVGAKFDSADSKLSGTLALYRITKNNVLTPDPQDPNNFSVAAGEVRSRGLELDVAGELGAGLRLSAALAWTDAEVSRDNNAFLVGRALANVPRLSANLQLVRSFVLAGQGMTLGLGVHHVGWREGAVAPLEAADNFRLPGYTTVRLSGSWRAARLWHVLLDVDNLLDRHYYSSAYMQAWVMPGMGRRVGLSLRYGG